MPHIVETPGQRRERLAAIDEINAALRAQTRRIRENPTPYELRVKAAQDRVIAETMAPGYYGQL